MTHSRVAAIGFSLALLSSACLVSRPEVPKPECEVDSECEAGKICGPGGRCTDACKADADCAAPRTCQSGACTLPTGTCDRSSDCAAGEVCSTGYRCAKACVLATECLATEACVGGACTTLASGACRFNSECPAPQACVQGRCAESCMADRDCPFGTTCQSNLCTPPAPGCLDATDCQAMQACGPQGDCVTACTSVAECAATGEACSNGACVRVGADTAGLTGSVVLSGVTDASGLSVTVEGPNRARGLTAMDGSYSFQGLLPGLYRVSITVPGTVEGSATREAAARANTTTPVPPFTLTPAGDVTGTIQLAGRTTFEGIQVVALGSGLGTVTAPDGSFTLRQLPVGSYDLLVAYTGYQAAQLTQVAVAFAQTTAAPMLTLQPVPSGSTFAFSSIPPSSARIDQLFTYQAVAGGGGVSAVTYALVDGPAGMTMNANTGQLTWQPAGLGTQWIVLSATGGGATVYQLFYLRVETSATEVFSGRVDRLAAVDGGVWLLGTELSFMSLDASVTTLQVPALSGTVTSLEHVNGRTVSSYAFPGGTVTDVRGPIGTLSGTWEGGVVGTVAGVDVRTVQSVTLLGGTSGTATVPTGDTIAAVSWPTGPITGLDDGRSTATGFRANTGLLGTVTSTGFTDPQATWTPDAFNALCVLNASGTARIGITSHTATTFILDSDPTSLLSAGQRYFLGSCSGAFTTTYTFVDANRTVTPVATGRQIDVYLPGLWVGNFPLTATTAPPNSTISFTAPVTQFAALQNAASAGFYTLALNAGLDVVITDTAAPWTTTTHSTSNFLYDDFATAFDVIASTTTTLTVRQPFGSLARDRTGRRWVLADTGNNVQVTMTLGTGGLTAGAAVGDFLWVDDRGEGFAIVSNTANAVTLDVHYTRFPLAGLVGGLVGRSNGSTLLPALSVPSTGLVAGAYAGRYAVRFTNGATPFIVDTSQLIIANSSTAFTVSEDACSGCTEGLAQRIASYSNVTWAPGAASPRKVDFRVALSGSPNFPPESLRGRFVVLESNRAARGTILHNDASSLVVEVDETWFAAFRGLILGDRLWLSETGSASTSPLKVKLTGQGAAWTADEWAGYSVIAPNSQVAGVVSANTATELDLTVTNTAAFLTLSAGANFAFARPHLQGTGCATPGVWIRTQLTLTGATLAANAYTHLRSEFNAGAAGRLALFSNTTTGASAYVCGSSFSNLIAMMGRPAAFDTNGRFNVTIEDSTASNGVDAHVGKYLYFSGSGGGRFVLPISSNTATSYVVSGIDSGDWFTRFPWRAALPGTRYLLTDVNSEATVVATVSPALTPGELSGRWLRANDSLVNSTGFGADLLVGSNTANTITFIGVDTAALDRLRNTGNAMLRHLSLSRGTALKVTDAAASLTPGALVGRTLRLQSTTFVITDNTATTITARSSSIDAFGNVSSASTWSVDVGSWREDLSVRPSGEVVALRSDGRVASVTPAGVVTWVTPFTGAQRLTVRTSPVIFGVLANGAAVSTYSTTWTDSAWSFAPDSLTNAYLRVRDCSSAQQNYLIRANTATSITAYDAMGCSNIAAGWRYIIDPARLQVMGTTLTPGALRGARLWMNGFEYLVRDNTASEVQLIYPDDYRVGPIYDVVEPGGTAFVLRGLTPSDGVSAVGADGNTAAWAATGSDVARFDGTAWERFDGATFAPKLRMGTVSFASAHNVLVDTAGGMTPGALVSKRLVIQGLVFTINANTSNSITISSTIGWGLQVPVPGTPYEVYEAEGVGSAQTFLSSGGTTWLGANNGLYRLMGSTWTHFTQASTESAPGARDGLWSDDVERLVLLPNGDLYVTSTYSGVSRLRGASWLTYTVANTQSAPNARDGLPDDDVLDVVDDGAGTLWFATGTGAARLMGTTWDHYGPAQGLTNWTTGVWLAPGGQVHLATGSGLFRIVP